MPSKRQKSQKNKTKGQKPLTFSIHGDDVDIEATFHNKVQVSQTLMELILGMRGTLKPSKQPAPQAQINELLSAFLGSLSVDQVSTLEASLSNEQKLMFADIMIMMQPHEESQSETPAQAS